MRLYEHEVKTLLADVGVPVPDGAVVAGGKEARAAVEHIGAPVAVKGQVLQGGRMRAGLVRFASEPVAAEVEAEAVLERIRPKGFTQVLVERAAEIDRELYVGFAYDQIAHAPVLLMSAEGGIDVEALGAAVPVTIPPVRALREHEAREAAYGVGLRGRDLLTVARFLLALERLFRELDCTLLEVNPLARLEDGSWCALDGHVALDGDARFRQQVLAERFGLEDRGDGARHPTSWELAARRIDAIDHRGVAGRLVEFDGSLGLIMGGGGASLTAFDAVLDSGIRPANYCEVGGNPSVRKTAALTRVLLEREGVDRVAVIMNVVSNTRVDIIARGVIAGCLDAGRVPAEAIAVFRVPGAWEDEARVLLGAYDITLVGRAIPIDRAAAMAVEDAA